MRAEHRTDELFEQQAWALHARTDRLFARLMAFQWAAAVIVALVVSPRTWSGTQSSVHLHVWLAILFGGVISIPPILLARRQPGSVMTRHVVAACQALWSAFLIHLTGGRIETHFHVFGSLAFVAFYRDWRVIVTASAVVAVDHIARGIWWPQSVYGVLTAAQWRWLEHAGWVVFEDIILIQSCRRGVQEMRDIASRQADLELTNTRIEDIVTERTRELESARMEVERQAQHERCLIVALPSLLVGVDGAGRVTVWNPTAESLLGLPASEALGRPISELCLSLDRDTIGALLGREGGVRELDEVPFRHADGTTGFLDLVVAPAGEGSLVIGTDVTDRKSLRDRLDESQRLESIGQLAAGIAHEINTPIQYVGDNVRFLEESFGDLVNILSLANEERSARDDAWMDRFEEAVEASDPDFVCEEVPKAFQQSLEGIGRVAEIVRAMKDFSHPGGDEMKPTDLNRAILSTITVARNEWKLVADVETDLEQSLSPVSCLPGQITQVVLNMIVNAAHAIADVVGEDGAQKGTIRLTTRADGDDAVITISDTGKGMPQSVRQRIFEPFFTTKEVGKGTGQGLAISHGVIVQKHGGSIDVDSEVGVGTTFTLRIPFDQATETESRLDAVA